jgi:hypothetical protein
VGDCHHIRGDGDDHRCCSLEGQIPNDHVSIVSMMG